MKRMFFISAILAMLLGSAEVMAKEHTIDRGETLESIARMYGVTPQAIIDANPGIKDMFFAGLVLQIPESDGYNVIDDNNVNYREEKYNNNIFVVRRDKDINNVADNSNSQESASNEDSELNFGYFTASYMAGFSDFGHGMYGLDWAIMFNKNFGGLVSLKANYGLAPEGSSGDIQPMIGLTGGVPLNEYVMPNIKVRGFFTAQSVPEGYTKTTSYSGTTTRNKNTTKLGGGMYFTPSINIKYKRFIVTIGYNLGFLCSNSPVSDSVKEEKKSSYTTYYKYTKFESKASFSHCFEIGVGVSI